jgi:Tol biopolymer transport system component/tRNA A-37 threonylcarbamoyl transferase component Bud32
MPLMAGAKLGPYEILAPLGAGGMGEVYRARDTKLGRDVALKVLPEAFAKDAERMARFKREALVLASLNHPNIASIYGLEDSGNAHALVMELVEGPTLADKILVAQGPRSGPAAFREEEPQRRRAGVALPIDEALAIANQIAEALEYAHEKGIIHRDLKPANIKVTPEGTVKVLDFGLAKALEREAASSAISDSPTLTQAATQAGVILGTAAYISPEQARGKPVDRRADIWAFGCVLYEMLVGERAFAGETTSDVLAAVIRADPDFAALPHDTPLRIRDLLVRSLNKDPKKRLRDIGDARIAIEETLSGADYVAAVSDRRATVGTPPLQRPWLRALPWALLAALGVGMALWSLLRAPSPAPRPVARLVINLSPTDWMTAGPISHIVLSPDGSRLVYAAARGGTSQLYVRPIDRFEATPIPGTERAGSPFFSPDGQSVGFFAESKLKRVSLSGGAPITVCVAADNRGGSWGPDDTIIFSPSLLTGLFRVAAAGGTPTPLTTLDREKGEFGHRYPEILPGGKAVLFTIHTNSNFDYARIGVLSLETGERRVLIEGGTYARYVPTGHLVYARAGGLLAVPFDLKRLQVTGPPVSILEGVTMNTSFGIAEFSPSADGSLAYIPGGATGGDRTLFWVDRKGATQQLPAPPRGYMSPRLSPDGRRLAVGIEGANPGVWVYDLERGTLTRLIENQIWFPWPIWSPDGKHVTFQSAPDGMLNVYWMPADGSGAAERLTAAENYKVPGAWSPDGKVLAYTEVDPATGLHVRILNLGADPSAALRAGGKGLPFLPPPSNEGGPAFSPDGRWLAYQSEESGRSEIYVRPFPGPGGKSLISTDGGTEPVWARNGRELFYRNSDKMMATAVETKPTFVAAKPRLLFEGHYETGFYAFEPNYDVSPDGQRFLMIKASEQESGPVHINVVLNWFEDLKRRVPTGK